MQQTLPSGSTEYNMAACTAIQNVAQKNLVTPQNFTKTFLQLILSSVESQDTVASDAWLTTLLDVIDVLPSDILQAEVFPVFAGKAHISKPTRIRVISCKVLGRLAFLLPAPVVTKDILPIIVSLCQDPYGTVRAAMCQELPNISQLINQESNKYVLHTIVDLASDEDSAVGEAALDAIAQLIPAISLASIKSIIIPLTKKLFKTSIEAEDKLLVKVAHVFGQYCFRLKDFLSLSDKVWFIGRYVHLSQLNTTSRKKTEEYQRVILLDEDELNQRLTLCRVECAYNFPAMVFFTADLKSEHLDNLLAVLRDLTSDSYYLVRRSIASGFHELFKLQPKWISHLSVQFVKLLKDENENVLEGLVPQIGSILSYIYEGSNFDKSEIPHAVLLCEKMLHEAYNWRLQSELLNQLEIIPKCFSPDFVVQHFVPVLMLRSMTSRTLPVRMAATKIILLIMADEAQAKQKQKMRSQLLELSNSCNFYCRIMFVRAMNMLLDISPKLLKDQFFHNIIAMTEDKVPNIRLALCKLLPKLKAIAYDPYDRRLVAALDSSIRKLSDERDRDVLEQMTIMHAELDELDHSKKSVKDYDSLTTLTTPRTFPQMSTNQIPQCQYGMFQPKEKNKGFEKGMPMSSKAIGESSQQKSTAASARLYQMSPPTSTKSPTRSPARSPVSVNRAAARRLDDILTSNAFLVDAGIALPAAETSSKPLEVKSLFEVSENSCPNKQENYSKNPTISKIQVNGSNILKPIRRLPTPRPTHRFTSFSGCLSNNVEKPDANNTDDNQEITDGSLVMENKNSSILKVFNKKFNEKPSGLPLKVNQVKLSTDVICENSGAQNVLKNQHWLQPPANRSTYTKKRFSLDIDTMSTKTIKMPNKYGNINKRYSLTVDTKKDTGKNNLTNINNNTKLSTPASTSSVASKHHQRPQSCVLKNSEPELFGNTKRSMSVENLPPRSIRATSRLPVRSIDPKASKPK